MRIAFIIIGIGILIYGFATGGTRDVLTKAVNICTECIGLG
ncbi:MAG: thioredoxin [Lachnospiraceae bacterium]|nr:thioredoxin [Lachnospiraceae bacterium]